MKKIQKSLFENKNNWKTKKLAFPKATIRVGSLFSGIGAFEQALKILKVKTKIMFACDNDIFAKKSFLANYKSAHYDLSQEKFTPPFKQISFNSQIKDNDGTLAKYVSKKLEITHQ